MGTRGLIVVRRPNQRSEGTRSTAVYNHKDSYPSWLGKKLFTRFSETGVRGTVDEILGNGDKWSITYEGEERDLVNNEGVDYLFHEWVYVIDLVEDLFKGYATARLDAHDLPGETDYHKGTVVEAFSTGLNDTLSDEALEKAQNDANDEAARVRNETLFGVNRSHYEEVLTIIREEAENLGMETVETLATHGRVEATLQVPGHELYVQLTVRQRAPRGEDKLHHVNTMFGTTPHSFSGSVKYEVKNGNPEEFKEILEKIRNGEAGRDFLKWRDERNLPGIGEELRERLEVA